MGKKHMGSGIYNLPTGFYQYYGDSNWLHPLSVQITTNVRNNKVVVFQDGHRVLLEDIPSTAIFWEMK